MLQFIHKKLRNQKLLNSCLFFGIVVLIAVLTLIPMFEGGALDDVIQYDFEQYAADRAEYPAVISAKAHFSKDDSGKGDMKAGSLEEVNAQVDSITDKWNRYLELPVVSTQKTYKITGGRFSSDLVASQVSLLIGTFGDMDKELELTDIDEASDDVIPCYMSRYMMNELSLTVGETLTFNNLTDTDGNPLRMKVVGIADEKDNEDYYWHVSLRQYSNILIVKEEEFDKIIRDFDFETVTVDINEMIDYRKINGSNIRATADYISQFGKLDKTFNCNFAELFSKYSETAKQVKVIIVSIIIPLLILLLIFIYMVSDRIADAEEQEINVLRSRGIPRMTIIWQYTIQSLFLTAASVIPGVILGYLMCKAGASSVDFLSFKIRETGIYTFRPEILISLAIAFPLVIILMIMPILKISKNTILTGGRRAGKAGKGNFVEKYFLDIILLGISLYLLYNYIRQKDVMIMEILSGKVADPLCLIDAELFTFGAAFFMIRISRLIITGIYKLREKKWKPATLAAFLEVIRTRRKSWVISVFLIITIAMGIYNANLAKTVNKNKRDRLKNDIGTEAILEPSYVIRPEGKEASSGWTVKGPDYSDILRLKDDGLVDSMTQVYKTDKLIISTSKKGKVKDVMLYGVDTAEFGKTADFDIMLNDHHWYEDLNALAYISNGAIISRDLAEDFSVGIGDTIELKLESQLEDQDITKSMHVQVVGILDAFPGFNGYFYTEEASGIAENKRYLAVVNSANLKISYGEIPPEIWMDLSEGTDIQDVAKALSELGIGYDKLTDMDEEIDNVFGSAVLLITNGLFNISFIVSLIICIIGFLIYWLTSINSRQMYFGVYRAMGLGMKGINGMLVKEHIFSTVTSLISSVVVGAASSILFIKLISCIYLPEKHSIAFNVYTSYSGLIRIGAVMITAIILCMVIIIRFIKKMNITEAIKMGQD